MLKDRLKEARLEAGLSQQEVADKAGVAQSTIMFLESGRNKSSRSIVSIAKALNVNADWLVTGVGEKRSVSNISSSEQVLGIDPWDDNTPLHENEIEIPYLKDVQVSAGNGCFQLEDYAGKKLRFSKRTLKDRGVNPTEAICVTASGDRMEPVIPDGCVVAVDTGNKTIKDGHIYAINNDGLLQIKVLKWVTGSQIAIESYNKSYDTIYRSIDEISVIGRVFWYSVLL